MTYPPSTYPTLARELLAARATPGLAGAVGLAVRSARRDLGLSQRRYAVLRGWSASHVARLEVNAGTVRLADVVAALDGTGFALALCRDPAPEDPDAPCSAGSARPPVATAQPVDPEEWPRTELLARVRGGRRRFPAHRETHRTMDGPSWWFSGEASQIAAGAPQRSAAVSSSCRDCA